MRAHSSAKTLMGISSLVYIHQLEGKHKDRDRESHEDDVSVETYATQTNSTDGEKRNSFKGNMERKSTVSVAELIGEYGPYQLSLTILTFIRYVCVAMMTNTGPLIAPSLEFWCKPPGSNVSMVGAHPNTSHEKDFLKEACSLKLTSIENGTGAFLYKCVEWTFDTTKSGTTLTDSYSLVCDRDWLRSAFQSTVSVGVVIASVVFGSFSDENGRRFSLKICCVLSLIAGSISIIAPDFTTYAISRSICSMSDVALVGSLYTIIVETLGNKYRGTVCIIVYTGWSIGVMIMPWITGYFMNFRHVMLFTVVCHLLSLPWLWTVGESIRWLLINGHTKEAEIELKRIVSWNTRDPYDEEALAENFRRMKIKFEAIAKKKEINSSDKLSLSARIFSSLFGGFTRVGQIFRSKGMTLTTVTIVWTSFNSELLYMLFIMINSDVGDNVKLNYAIGGLMEIIATVLAIVLISSFKRKLTLTSTLVIISASIFCLAFTHGHSSWSIPVLNFTKLAISTLSSLIYVMATELFPTSLRQTGIGLTATLGSFGAVVAPFIRRELTDTIGMTNVMLLLFVLPLSAASLIPLFLRETKDIELPDDVDEILDRETKGTQQGQQALS